MLLQAALQEADVKSAEAAYSVSHSQHTNSADYVSSKVSSTLVILYVSYEYLFAYPTKFTSCPWWQLEIREIQIEIAFQLI